MFWRREENDCYGRLVMASLVSNSKSLHFSDMCLWLVILILQLVILLLLHTTLTFKHLHQVSCVGFIFVLREMSIITNFKSQIYFLLSHNCGIRTTLIVYPLLDSSQFERPVQNECLHTCSYTNAKDWLTIYNLFVF